MARPRGKYTQWAPPPVGRTPPFLLVREGAGLVLLTPFRKRRRGLTPGEAALVRTIAERLAEDDMPVGICWIDPQDGTATAAQIGEGQLRRRLIDDASFSVGRREQ